MQHKEKSSIDVPSAEDVGNDIFGYMAGKVKILGDVVGPITPVDDWECMIGLRRDVLLWMASDPDRLSAKAREAIRDARQNTGVAVATITLWELAWLAQNGRIQILTSVESFVRETVARVILKPMNPECRRTAPFGSLDPANAWAAFPTWSWTTVRLLTNGAQNLDG